MSAKELKNFENQLSLLTFAEQITIMEYLLKLMKKRQSEFSDNIFNTDAQAKNDLDEAIAEVERGDIEVFNSFDDFKVAKAR